MDFGVRTLWMTEDTSSNYKEATNLVLYLIRLFCASSRLHEMILDLRKIELEFRESA